MTVRYIRHGGAPAGRWAGGVRSSHRKRRACAQAKCARGRATGGVHSGGGGGRGSRVRGGGGGECAVGQTVAPRRLHKAGEKLPRIAVATAALVAVAVAVVVSAAERNSTTKRGSQRIQHARGWHRRAAACKLASVQQPPARHNRRYFKSTNASAATAAATADTAAAASAASAA